MKILYAFVCFILFILCGCSKKQPVVQHDLKTQLELQQTNIPFAATYNESNKWYKQYFFPLLKGTKQTKVAKEYEEFAKLYFADLSQMRFQNTMIDSTKLLQSVTFTYFAQELLKEYLFINAQDTMIAPWDQFDSKFSLEGIVSASFVARVAEYLKILENESYENFNQIALALNLLRLTQKYSGPAVVSTQAKEITKLSFYQLPSSLYSFLFYKIFYMQYYEKFQSNFLLNRMAKESPKGMAQATSKILQVQFTSDYVAQTQKYYNFPAFDHMNLLTIAQCKAGATSYPARQTCIKEVFIPWIRQMQTILAKQSNYMFFPIFAESKLCMLVWRDRVLHYPENTGKFCTGIYTTWKNHWSMKRRKK